MVQSVPLQRVAVFATTTSDGQHACEDAALGLSTPPPSAWLATAKRLCGSTRIERPAQGDGPRAGRRPRRRRACASSRTFRARSSGTRRVGRGAATSARLASEHSRSRWSADVLGPGGDPLREALVVLREERAGRLLVAGQVPRHRGHEAAGRLASEPRTFLARSALPRLVDEAAQRGRDAVRLLLEPVPVPRQQRHLAAHDSQARPTRARAPGRRRPFDDLLGRAPEVEVDLAPGLVLEDEDGLARAVVQERLRLEQHRPQGTRDDPPSGPKRPCKSFLHPRLL